MNSFKSKQLHGAIRSGQYWKKRDNGMIMTVICRQDNNSWRVAFAGRGAKGSHKIKEHVIYKFYDKLQ